MDLLDWLVPPDVTRDLYTDTEIGDWVIQHLEAVCQDTRDHVEIASDPGFTVTSVLPTVLATAVRTAVATEDDKCISELLPGSNRGRREVLGCDNCKA